MLDAQLGQVEFLKHLDLPEDLLPGPGAVDGRPHHAPTRARHGLLHEPALAQDVIGSLLVVDRAVRHVPRVYHAHVPVPARLDHVDDLHQLEVVPSLVHPPHRGTRHVHAPPGHDVADGHVEFTVERVHLAVRSHVEPILPDGERIEPHDLVPILFHEQATGAEPTFFEVDVVRPGVEVALAQNVVDHALDAREVFLHRVALVEGGIVGLQPEPGALRTVQARLHASREIIEADGCRRVHEPLVAVRALLARALPAEDPAVRGDEVGEVAPEAFIRGPVVLEELLLFPEEVEVYHHLPSSCSMASTE